MVQVSYDSNYWLMRYMDCKVASVLGLNDDGAM